MRRSSLPDTNPEFSVTDWPTHREYRVENWRLSRDGSSRVIKGAAAFKWQDTILVLLVSYAWPKIRENQLLMIALFATLLVVAYMRCTQVLYESLLILPLHGLQLETHYGLPPFDLSTSRRFIPASALRDFVLNEGLRRWDVRYYLVAIKNSTPEHFSLEVAFPNLLPHLPVLEEIYRNVHEIFFEK